MGQRVALLPLLLLNSVSQRSRHTHRHTHLLESKRVEPKLIGRTETCRRGTWGKSCLHAGRKKRGGPGELQVESSNFLRRPAAQSGEEEAEAANSQRDTDQARNPETWRTRIKNQFSVRRVEIAKRGDEPSRHKKNNTYTAPLSFKFWLPSLCISPITSRSTRLPIFE